METIKEIVAKNCNRLLDKSRNLSAIARQMQINPTTISRWKSGEHAPELDKIDKLAEILGVDPMEFFKREGDSDPLTMIRQIASLGPSELEILKDTLDTLSTPMAKKALKKEN